MDVGIALIVGIVLGWIINDKLGYQITITATEARVKIKKLVAKLYGKITKTYKRK